MLKTANKILLLLTIFIILNFFKSSSFAQVITYGPGECMYVTCDTRCVTSSGTGCYHQRQRKFCCWTSVYYDGVFHHAIQDCNDCSNWYTDGSCSCTACNNCCTPVPCQGCTPAIPAGYTDVNNGCSITTTRSCTGNNGCGSSCTITRTRWLIETNIAEEMPTSLSTIIDGEPYQLSLNPSTPTTIKYPSTEENVQISIPSKVTPPSSDGLGYSLKVNNYGINNEWIAYTDCTNPRAEDFCSESTTNTQNFQPSSLDILDVLKQNAEGKLSGLYYTVNRCNSGKIYSLPIETYYIVDNNPNVDPNDPDPTPNPPDVCDWDSSLLASDPNCVDPDDPTDSDPVDPLTPDDPDTKKEFFPDVGYTDSTSFRGCYSEDYTGLEVNNPVKIRVGGTDVDGREEIKGAVIWFSKSNITPTLPLKTDTYTSTNTDEIGIMILQNNNSWNNDPLIYGINTNNTWGLLNDDTLRNISSNDIARIHEVDITEGDELVTFELSLEFLPTFTENISGIYNFKTIVLDKYMILSDGRVDISHMPRYFNWGIDLERPEMVNLNQTVLGPRELYLNWNIDGTNSGITDVVVNGYRDGSLINDTISLLGYPNLITLDPIPPELQTGHLTDTNSWIFSYNPPYPSPDISTDQNRINIGDNEGGVVSMYATAFDQGCNANLRAHNIDLRPWIASKGGIVYSKGSLGSSAKDVSEVSELDGALKNILKDELDTGTELVSSRQDFINNLINPDLGAVRAINTYDSNDKKNYWFEYLKRKLEEQKTNAGESMNILETEEELTLVTSSSATCTPQENCLIYSTEDITVQSGFVCDKNTLIMSEKDIIINPDITEPENNQSTVGCIFVAKRNISIKEGERKSVTTVGYDYIEGFLIAENQILVDVVDINEDIRDGLEVKGGLVAMGNEGVDSAILLERNLRLYNYSHPTLVTAWDIKYARLSEIFFGIEAPMYKQEVGFKVF